MHKISALAIQRVSHVSIVIYLSCILNHYKLSYSAETKQDANTKKACGFREMTYAGSTINITDVSGKIVCILQCVRYQGCVAVDYDESSTKTCSLKRKVEGEDVTLFHPETGQVCYLL